ncbi:MAG TPA: hypothetical protein VEB39_07950 [Sphingomicrobium sp.]|nr:hypothetical protein [Sphingomicrobium sp.]
MTKTGTIQDIEAAIANHFRARCPANKKTPPAAMPKVTRRATKDPQGFNWAATYPCVKTKEEALWAIGQARTDGWMLL